MVSKTRSQAIKLAWKKRKPKATCAYCDKKLWVRGIKRNGKWWHENCYERFVFKVPK